MTSELRQRLFAALDAVTIVDPHTHIDPLAPASKNLAEILGYHYFTELCHASGMPRGRIEEPGLDPREKVERLFQHLGPLNNTIQYAWFIEICRDLLGYETEVLEPDDAGPLWDRAAERMGRPDWESEVLSRSGLEAVFLTNEFDDPLAGFDTARYVPCLRTDDLVFRLAEPTTRQRLANATGIEVTDSRSLRTALESRFRYFIERGAKACAISLPPSFAPHPVVGARADRAIGRLAAAGEGAEGSDREAAAQFVFWTLAELCREHALPFDLMIGVNRGVYAAGVHQGRDLFDMRLSLLQYRELFNAFPQVRFPVSVLASTSNQELVAHAWIFPNVLIHGHWWYSNTPSTIEHDLAARLEAVPRTKVIGYYSDMYKLEFALPKFRMFKRILAKVLAERFVLDRGWSEERAVDLGLQVLQRNTRYVFGV